MSKKKKRSRRAGKGKAKAAPKRRRRRAGKGKAKAAPKRRRRRAGKGKAKAAPKRRRRRAKGKAKAAPKRRRRRAAKGKAKAAPKRRRRRGSPKAALKRLSKASSAAARAMGMLKGKRKNPGGVVDFLKTEAMDMMAIAPSVAVQLGAMAAIGYASSMATAQIRKRVSAGGAADKFAGVISSGAITLAAFAAMKMIKNEKVRQFTLPVLFGGMAATAVNALAAIKVKKDAAQISLGQHLGLPIGDYMSLSGFIDVHGRPLAVDGYVAEQLGSLHLSQGPYHEGTVVSMGDYTAQQLGELSIRPTIEGAALGEIGQMSEGRQGARALGAEGDSTIESFVDSGSLSGSVFD